MKKGVYILLGMFMMISTVEAKKGNNLPNRYGINHSYNNAVNFIERGVEFFVFTNGDFDFDTSYNNRGVRIYRDNSGRIRSVGNTYINYDFRGNVTRIGTVFIRYYRGKLSNVGDLNVRYNRYGNPIFYGNVKDYYYNNGVRFNINFGDVCEYNDNYFYRNDFRKNYIQFREDNNFYYYKARPNAKIGKRSTILKRRKTTDKRITKRVVKRNSNNSFRKGNNNRVKIDKNSKIKSNSNISRKKRIEKQKKYQSKNGKNTSTKRRESPERRS